MKSVLQRIRFFHKRGDWTPLIPYPFRAIIMLSWCILPIIYGVDYLHENPARANRLSAVEDLIPLYAWGLLMMVNGIAVTACMLMRWRLRAVISLHILGALWATLGAGLLLDSIEFWGGDGFRSSALFFTVAINYWGAAAGYYAQKSWVYQPMLFIKQEEGE